MLKSQGHILISIWIQSVNFAHIYKHACPDHQSSSLPSTGKNQPRNNLGLDKEMMHHRHHHVQEQHAGITAPNRNEIAA